MGRGEGVRKNGMIPALSWRIFRKNRIVGKCMIKIFCGGGGGVVDGKGVAVVGVIKGSLQHLKTGVGKGKSCS